jgi:preprotein translocase subunit YajC
VQAVRGRQTSFAERTTGRLTFAPGWAIRHAGRKVRLDESELILADFGWWLLAEAEEGAAPAVSPLLSFLPSVVMVMLLYYFLIAKPQRQRESGHKILLQNLKKNDRVVTIGGIYGVVVNVQREQDEVTIKVDESTNAKLRVTFNAIARVITADEPGDKTEKT